MEQAEVPDFTIITVLTAELLQVIEAAIGKRSLRFDAASFLVRGVQPGVEPLGFLALFEAFTLYVKGAFRLIIEFHGRPGNLGASMGGTC
jgi:hypothetical protein